MHYSDIGFVIHGEWNFSNGTSTLSITSGLACFLIYLLVLVRDILRDPSSYATIFPSADTVHRILWPSISTLGIVRSYGCPLVRNVFMWTNANARRSTPFLNIHWYDPQRELAGTTSFT